ncbi:putative transcriptional regulator [Hoeflea phototrophica DFL-43]|uniref:Putative transcriptional regulator n=1 Tax=Hoeflea phototrophica (strain DSM 17068 / NCIMB 14078 / DFL-43) TaxID=411684 RepID=A9CYB0_HOEPD|nr:helix-turn-helix transcriptional regulator [Hoeflea phototrophica]EDQ34553.1 putative transcriptional regulator [Hoeflea phototrophica DFL-43]
MSNERPDMAGFREKALKDPEVRAEYDALGSVFQMKRQMIALRKQAGLTQEQMAEKLGTKKSNISRLESLNSDVSPRLATLEDYARVLGYSVTVGFEPEVDRQQ